MSTDAGTGWERHRRVHFDEIVAAYDRVRPEYPAELFADIVHYAERPNAGKRALEIGAGTGKATAPFLDAGYDITAVEIGANMAEFLMERFKGHQGFRVVTAAFEEASLPEESYDLIYAASAFHWVDAEIGCPKALRLLRSGGVFALFRYNIVPAEGEALYEAIQAVYDKHYYSYYTSKARLKRIAREEFSKPVEILRGYGFEDMERYGFSDVTMKLYDAERIFGADEFITFCDTLADHRNLPDRNRAALYAGIREAIAQHGGWHKEDNVFQLYMGRKM